MNARIGAMPQLAHTQHDLAVALRARAARGDVERAAALDARRGHAAPAAWWPSSAGSLASRCLPPPRRAWSIGEVAAARLRREGDF
jgi:hypothetical protein